MITGINDFSGRGGANQRGGGARGNLPGKQDYTNLGLARLGGAPSQNRSRGNAAPGRLRRSMTGKPRG